MMNMSRRAASLLAMLLSLALVAAACGDETTEATASSDESAMADHDTDTDTDTAADADHSHDHDHDEGLEVPEGMAVPTVALRTAPDSVKGINLFVDLEDFRIAPEHASTEAIDGEGHLHLYVDGERVMRFYNTALHLGDLEPGERRIMVEVSANDHRAYSVDGEPIRAMTTVSVPEPSGDHAHGATDSVAAPEPTPVVDLAITEDPKTGWNVAVELANLTLAPEAEGTDPVDGQGHLHLYVDGERITRLYGLNWHLPALTEGSHEVMVEVSANDHRAYAIDEEPIMAAVAIEVPADKATPAAGDDDEQADAATADADQVIEATVADGEVTVADTRIDVERGSTVLLRISADATDEVHLHGYDVLADVTPDQAAELRFTADTPGVFEVELEGAGTFLFEVAVS